MVDRSPPTFDAWDPPESRLEAIAFGLFAVRRALTQSLVGLPGSLLWHARGEDPAPGAVVRGAWDREFQWIWPRDLEAPALPAEPTLVELFYGLVRHRAVTEELLMAASEADLSRQHESRATLNAPQDLGVVLVQVASLELGDLERLYDWRLRAQPEWGGIGELLTRARAAVAEAGTTPAAGA